MSRLINVQMGTGAGLLGLQLEKVPDVGDEITITNANFVDMPRAVLRRMEVLGLTLRITEVHVSSGKTWCAYTQIQVR